MEKFLRKNFEDFILEITFLESLETAFLETAFLDIALVDDFDQGEIKSGRRLKFQINIWGSILLDMVRINL